jgi:hypothetical protein
MGGCGHYRCIWPARAAIADGAPIDLVMPDEPAERQLRAMWLEVGDRRTLQGVEHPGADVVVLQRPLDDFLALAVPHLQAKGVRVVVEIDDDFDAISPRNVSWASVDPARNPRRNRNWLRQACLTADLVVCSTPALARRYAPHGRGRVVRNRVPAHYLEIERETHDDVAVGWSGSVDTHPDDLQVCGGGVARALRATGATFGVVGTGRGVKRRLGLPTEPLASGWLPIEAYPRALAQLDIGIVPLEITPFNEAKSCLKMMEMAALGVVPIGSPTAENRWLYSAGIGLLAGSPRHWEGQIKELAGDPARLAEVAAATRERMAALTIEANAFEWAEAWASAVEQPRRVA